LNSMCRLLLPRCLYLENADCDFAVFAGPDGDKVSFSLYIPDANLPSHWNLIKQHGLLLKRVLVVKLTLNNILQQVQ
jgi:hypothetical protein